MSARQRFRARLEPAPARGRRRLLLGIAATLPWMPPGFAQVGEGDPGNASRFNGFGVRVDGRDLDFGVSGLLYNSDVLLYDRQTGSLWSQLKAQAVTGPMIGKRLAMLALERTTWKDWRSRRHPDTQVLSFDTGFVRDDGRDPHAGYDRDPTTMFPVSVSDGRLAPKAWVVGVVVDGRAKAYPFEELARTGGVVEDRLGGTRITVRYDAAHRSARIVDARGRELPSVTAFRFAWVAFNPSTALFAAARPGEAASDPPRSPRR